MLQRIFVLIMGLLCFTSILGQQLEERLVDFDYKAVYKSDFYPDSLEQDNQQTEYWVLYGLGNVHSFFTTVKNISMDSIKRVEREKGNSFGPSMEWYDANGTKIRTVVSKDLKNEEIEVHDKMAPNVPEVYMYAESDVLDWELTEDTLHIGEAVCSGARVSFGGREWQAWFNPEVPVTDGPYKFYGLPGLIFRVEDTTGSWRFSLVELEKEEGSFPYNGADKKHIKITKKEFNKNKRYLYDNRIMMMKNRGYTFKDEKKSKKKYDKDNNWIELIP